MGTTALPLPGQTYIPIYRQPRVDSADRTLHWKSHSLGSEASAFRNPVLRLRRPSGMSGEWGTAFL
jgi:hypothetical protein